MYDASAPAARQSAEPAARTHTQIAFVDLLDRLLGSGVVLAGDIVISLSGVDLVQIRLQALVSTVRDELTEAS